MTKSVTNSACNKSRFCKLVQAKEDAEAIKIDLRANAKFLMLKEKCTRVVASWMF